jgi:hypothetical protein
MDEKADTVASLPQGDEPPGFAESARFEARSVTGASYTIVERMPLGEPVGADREGRGERAKGRRYRTAYAGLAVVANDDGSFTIVATHTRLVRVAHA